MTATDFDNQSAPVYFRRLRLARYLLRRARFDKQALESGHVEAGSAADCGHVRDSGEFGPGNECAKCDRQCKLEGWLEKHKHYGEDEKRNTPKGREYHEKYHEYLELKNEQEMKPWRDEQEKKRLAIKQWREEKRRAKAEKLRKKEEERRKKEEAAGYPRRGFHVTPDMLPRGLRENLTEGDLAYIRSRKTLEDVKRLYKESVKGLKSGEMVTLKELATIARIGQSTKGQYAWTGNFLKKTIGERKANIWAALNSVLSATTEYRAHTKGSMMLLDLWVQAGEPRKKEEIEALIDKVARKTRTNKEGEEVSLGLGLINFEKNSQGRPIFDREGERVHEDDKWAAIVNILSDPDRKDLSSSITTQPGIIAKTKEFYKAWFDKASFVYDKWMSRLTKPRIIDGKEVRFMGKKAVGFLIRAISGTSTPDDLSKPDEDTLKTVTAMQENMVSRQGYYLAYKAVASQAAKQLTRETGEQWSTTEVQEAAWSATIAIAVLKAYSAGKGKKEKINVPESLTHEMIHQSWDIQEIFKDEGIHDALIRLGVSEAALAFGDDLQGSSGFPLSPAGQKRGKVESQPGDRETLAGLTSRIPKASTSTIQGKGIYLPTPEGGVKLVHQYIARRILSRLRAHRSVARWAATSDPRSWVSCGGDETVHGPASTLPKFLSSEQVARIIANQFHNRPLHFKTRDMEQAWSASTLYELKSIPAWLITPLAQVKPGRRSHSSGPIIVDINKNDLERHFGSFGHDMRIAVLDGKHRLHEHVNEHGDSEIEAFVGTEAIPIIEEVVNDFGPLRESFVEALDRFYSDPDDHRTWHELIDAAHGVGLGNSQLRRLWHEFARGRRFNPALGIFTAGTPS